MFINIYQVPDIYLNKMFFIYFIATNILRPLSTNLILEQEDDVGTASSLMNMSFNLFGFVGMLLASVPFGNMVTAVGIMIAAASMVSIALWAALVRGTNIKGLY